MAKMNWTKMSASELAKATREFDKGSGPPARPAPPREMAKHKRAQRRGRGRPKLGTGAIRVLFTVNPKLLKHLDRYAQEHDINRSTLISMCIEAYIEPASGRRAGAA
jgi:hypothetical protein